MKLRIVNKGGEGSGNFGHAGRPGEFPSPVATKELPIDPKSQKALVEARLNIFNDEANALAEKVYTGEITIGQWEEAMRALTKDIHNGIAAIMNGGWDKMTNSLWGKLGAPMRQQYKYLHGFADWIAKNKDNLNLGTLQARARMYGQAAVHPAMKMSLPLAILDQLPWLPKDGSTECLVNCKCVWVLTTERTRRKQTVRAVWRMTPAEHCGTCLERSGYTVTFELPLSVEVPSIIGGI